MTLSARVVLITGASRGLGLEYVKQTLMSDSVEILIATCRNPNSAAELQAIARLNPVVKIVKLDIGCDEDLELAFQEVKAAVGELGLNLLISNAAIYDRSDSGGIEVQTRDKLQSHLNINVTGPILVVQKFLPLLQLATLTHRNKDSSLSCNRAGIVLMSSRVGSQNIAFDDGPGASLSLHYKCSKTALNMAMILISRELGPKGILAFALHPGWVKTEMGTDRAPLYPNQSIEKCLNVIGNAGKDLHGKLVDLNGEVIPY